MVFQTRHPLHRSTHSYRHVWKAYFNLLLTVAQSESSQPALTPKDGSESPNMSRDVQEGHFRRDPTQKALEAELDRTQNTYERLLLQEVPFPKAHELNEEVEAWANMIMKNWRLHYMADRTSGGSSKEEKLSVTRKVLDVRPPPIFGPFYLLLKLENSPNELARRCTVPQEGCITQR